MGTVKRVKRSGGWGRRFERKARWARRRKKCRPTAGDRFAVALLEGGRKGVKVKVSF